MLCFAPLPLTVDFAVGMAHQALFMNNGQVCSAGSRTFVHEDIYDEFVAKATAMAVAKKVSNPLTDGCENGPIVSCWLMAFR